ncbi:MAG TPA: glycosyltransferase family 2 protein [Planctomycetota bacterium]|nr:glycosyltransferase family 2 protein [Planctomycetota bacterium]
MKLLVAILNWRTPRLVVECLRSLEPEVAALGSARVIVTDNDSGDDSLPMIGDAIRANGWQSWAELMPLPKNGGFAYGNNAAIRIGLAENPPVDYVLLLNPDTVVRPGAIRSLLEFLQKNPKVGLVGSRLEDPDGTPQRSAFRFHTLIGDFERAAQFGPLTRLFKRWVIAPPPPETPSPADWVAGASMLVRREVFDAIGLLDEGFFLYFEETDFCLRAARAGWPCWYEPGSRVVHFVGQATGVTDPTQRRRRPLYWFNSRRRYFLKNYGPAYAALADVTWWMGLAAWRARCVAFKHADLNPPRLLRDAIANSVFAKGFSL